MRSSVRLLLVAIALLLSAGPAVAQISPTGGDPSHAMDTPPTLPRSRDPGLDDRLSVPASDRASSALYAIPGRNASPLAGPVDPNTYRLGPGDVLLLQFWGRMSESVPIEVSPEGRIIVPNDGSLNVDGRTLADVRKDVLEALRARFVGVNMDLRLARPRVFRVYLTGQVHAPGPIDASGGQRACDVLTPATLLDNASRRHIEVRHRDGTRESCDLDLFLTNGSNESNPWLRDGDVLYVPTATEFVWALGAVAKPARYELGTRDSLLTLLRLAGDPVPAADIERVLLVDFHDPLLPDSTWLDLRDIYSGGQNPELTDGARIYLFFVPHFHQQHEASIFGEVRRPGVYPVEEGSTRLSYLVEQAYGFLPTADLSAIRVRRVNPAAEEKDPELDRLLRLSRNELTSTEYEILRTKLSSLREDYRVDWNRLQADPKLDLLLRDADVVWVGRLVSSIRMDGELRRPGILNYSPGLKLDDYVRECGGYTDRAWRGKVRVTRAVTGQTLLARNVTTLDPGDFVWVPEKPDVTVWQQAREIITALAGVATIVIAIRSVR